MIMSEVGRLKTARVHPIKGLGVIRKTGGKPHLEEVETAILNETNAHVVIRVLVGVGIQHGKVVLENKSRIWVMSKDVIGNMVLNRSFVSDEVVVDEAAYKLSRDKVYTINAAKFERAVNDLFPIFIQMAFESAPLLT